MTLSVDTILSGSMVRASVDVPTGVVWTLTGTARGTSWVAARETGRGSVHWVSDPMAPLGVPASYRLTYGSTVETAGPVTRTDAGATLITSMDGRTVARVDRMASGGDLWDWQATTSLLDIQGYAPVARYGQPVARDGGAVVETTGQDTRTLVELVRAGRPVIVLHDEAACQIPDCDIAPTMRVTLTGHRADRAERTDRATRSWDLSWREARPPWRFAAPVATYDDVRERFSTHQDLVLASSDGWAAAMAVAGKSVLVQQAAEPVGDPDALWVDEDGVPHVWADYGPSPRENLIVNPRFDPTGPQPTPNYGGGGTGTMTQVVDESEGPFARISWTNSSPATGAAFGFGLAALSPTAGSVAPGDLVAGGIEVRPSTDRTVQLILRIVNASGSLVDQKAAAADLPAGVWTRIDVPGWTAPANSSHAFFHAVNILDPTLANGPRNGETFDVRHPLIEKADAAGIYGDGSMPGWSWTGTANNSTSTYAGPAWVYAGDEVRDAGERMTYETLAAGAWL